MRVVVITQRIRRCLRFVGRFDVARHFRPDLRAQRVRRIQLLVIPAGIDRRKNGKNGLAGIERDFRRVLRQRRRSSEGADKSDQRSAKLGTQEKPPAGPAG